MASQKNDAGRDPRPVLNIHAPVPELIRAGIRPYQQWIEQTLCASSAEIITIEFELPLHYLFLPELLPGVDFAWSEYIKEAVAVWPKLARWTLPDGNGPRLAAKPSVRGNSQVQWTPEWRDCPVALWFEELTQPFISVQLDHAIYSDGLEREQLSCLIVRRDAAVGVLQLLGNCLKEPRKRVRIWNGRHMLLPRNSYQWDRVVLDPETRRLVRDDFEQFLVSKPWFQDHDLPYRRGYLFYGAPGNGKTSAIRVMASHAEITAFTVDLGDEDIDNRSLTRLFMDASERAPALIILEDLDRIFGREAVQIKRSVTLQHLLNCLDGVGTQEGLIVVATANDPSELDPAILRRPGRFDRVVEFRPPAPPERAAFFARQRCLRLSLHEQELVALESAGFSFAQLREAYVLAGQSAYSRQSEISAADLHEGIRQIRSTLSGINRFQTRARVGFDAMLA